MLCDQCIYYSYDEEYEEYEEERKKSLLRKIESCKSILERDFGMKFE